MANGRLTGHRSRGGRTLWRYSERHPMASELVQVAVGDLTVARPGARTGSRSATCSPGRRRAGRCPGSRGPLSRSPGWRHGSARYPFELYGVLAADMEFSFALETQTLSLFPLGFLPRRPEAREPILLHELAHQWFGDSVSPRRWSDVWLSEGHATWYEYLYGQSRGWRDLDQTMRAVYAGSDGCAPRTAPWRAR